MMITGINFIFDILFRTSAMMIEPFGFFLIGSILSEGAASYFCYTVYKIVRDLAPAEGMEMGGSGYTQQGDNASGPPSYPQTPQVGPATNFTPFAGTGNRLGG